jgi:uncharacterized iron-regulated protein
MKTRHYIPAIVAIILLILSPSVLLAQATAQDKSAGYYIPYHIYDTQTKTWIDLETLLAAISQDDVVFLGEQHNDTYTHQLQLAILQGASRRRGSVVLAMEMFERDVQSVLNSYVTGKISETEFLSQSRPWSNYPTDYRPLVEFARSNGWPVIGSNAPTRLARVVSANGINIVDKLSESDRKMLAEQVQCPLDSYWERFSKVMMSIGGSHGSAVPNPHNPHSNAAAQPGMSSRVEQLYQAQCVKDETMAESVVRVLKDREGVKPLVIHVNGDFHSAYGEGTVARARRRLPEAKIKNVSFIPITNLDKIPVEEYIQQGNYLVFTLKESDQE